MIPLATTRITATTPDAAAQQADPYGDGYEANAGQPTVVARHVRAVIAPGGASGGRPGAESERAEFTLKCDPIALSYLDTVTDESSGVAYAVVWAITTPAPAGLGHTTAGLLTLKGQTP